MIPRTPSVRQTEPDPAALLCLGLSPASLRKVQRTFPEAVELQSISSTEAVAAACAAVGPAVLVIHESALPQATSARPPLLSMSPGTAVLVLCQEEREGLLEEALSAGCAGVLREDASDSMVRRAVVAIRGGELWFPRRLLSQVARRVVAAPVAQRLTAREAEILHLLGRNEKNQAIADKLFISRETVRWHLRALYAKLGVSSRDAAQQYARQTASTNPVQEPVSAPGPGNRTFLKRRSSTLS